MNADWSTLLSSRESVQATSLVQNKKLVKSKRLKQITKAILRMNIAMRITGGLEPAGPFGGTLESSQIQLADHSDCAAELGNRIDDANGRTNTVEENLDILAARQSTIEQETLEGYNARGQSTNCVTHGVMELPQFVRHADAKKTEL